MGWANAIGNIILALAVAYLPLIPLSFVWSVADPIHGSSMATIIGGFLVHDSVRLGMLRH